MTYLRCFSPTSFIQLENRIKLEWANFMAHSNMIYIYILCICIAWMNYASIVFIIFSFISSLWLKMSILLLVLFLDFSRTTVLQIAVFQWFSCSVFQKCSHLKPQKQKMKVKLLDSVVEYCHHLYNKNSLQILFTVNT